jgi:type I restriction enzyme, S subunit
VGKYQGYERYKESGVEWLGDIPDAWEFGRIKFIGHIKYGLGEPPEKLDDGLPIIRATDIYRGVIDGSNVQRVNPDKVPWSRNPELKTGDILVVRSGAYTGDSAIVTDEWAGSIAGYDMVLTPIQAHPKYIAWNFLSRHVLEGQLYLAKSRAAQPHLNAEELGNTVIAIPPLDEQESIAYFLDRKTTQIDALIAKKAALLEKLDEKRTALISHAVTKGLDSSVPMKDSGVEWLGDIPEHWDCLSLRLRYSIELGKMLDQRKISGDYLVKYLRNVDVQWDFINQDELPEMDINPREYERYLVKEGDLLVCEGGESGRSAIVQSTENIIGFQKAIHRLRPIDKQEISRYLLYTFYYVSKLGVFIAEGNPNTITHLTSEKLKLYKLPRPSRIEQELIVEYLDQKTAEIDLQKVKVKEAIELLKEYRTALITNAVTGKIDVRQVAI